MQAIVEWIRTHLPVVVNEEGLEVVYWRDQDGLERMVRVDYLIERFGAVIEQAMQASADIVATVLATETDPGWQRIWQLWRERGYMLKNREI